MSSYGDTMYHPSPPSSSGGGLDSAGGTPYTSVTAFSPEDARTLKSTIVNSGDGTLESNLQDPFVSTSTQPRGRLSATASTFRPSFEVRATPASAPAIADGSAQNDKIPDPSDYLEHLLAAQAAQSPGRATQQADATQFGTFTTDTHSSRYIKVSGSNIATFLPTVEASKKKVRDRGIAKRGSERREEMGDSYYLRLSNIRDAMELYNGIKMNNPDLTVEYISPVTFGKLFSPGGRYSAHEAQVVLTVNYPAASNPDMKLLEDGLIQMLEVEGRLYAWQKLSATPTGTFRMVAEYEDATHAPRSVSRSRKINEDLKLQNVTVSIDLHRPDFPEQFQSQQISPTVTPTRRSGEQSGLSDALGNMSLQGSARSADSAGTPAGTIPTVSSMPYMAASSGFAMPNTLPFVMGGNLYVPSVVGTFQQTYSPGVLPQVSPGLGEPLYHPYTTPSYPHGGFHQHGFGIPSPDFQQPNFGNEFGYYNQSSPGPARDHYNRPNGRRSYAPKANHTRDRHQHNSANSHHNHVDINRIRQGIDVRTTVMLRNIPNKVDQAMLKEIVDESSFGRYDFMYLRIDFSNNCNVGYAFINFTDPLDIVDFVVARSNQKWHRFKSDKVAEVSYATIQGKDCLVQKFRNSSVMLEPPHYRPKLYKTIHDPFGHAGEEERFPESDNASKLKRSCENAEHVGLFAPSAGQHLRDEQRRRRSQYDRGTSLAEREEYGYDDSTYNQFGFPHY